MPWGRNRPEGTNSTYPVTLKERVFICYLILTQLPDEAIDELTDDISETLEYYKARREYLGRKQPKLKSSQVTATIGETRIRPKFYLPFDEELAAE